MPSSVLPFDTLMILANQCQAQTGLPDTKQALPAVSQPSIFLNKKYNHNTPSTIPDINSKDLFLFGLLCYFGHTNLYLELSSTYVLRDHLWDAQRLTA